ncbi:MAG: hypothetical protein ACYCW6_10020 [Candidatus Xenobia bacterium]
MRRLLPIVALLVLVGFVTATLAAGDQIYISNQLYRGRTAKQGGVTLVHLDDFLKAAGVSRDSLNLKEVGATVSGSYHGKAFTAPAYAHPDGLYVDGKALVLGLGGRWDVNAQLGLVDVSIPGAYPAVASAPGSAPAAAPSGTASASASPAGTDAETAKNPLKITDFEFVNPALATPNAKGGPVDYLVRGKLKVKNVAQDYVDGVEIVIHIQDGYHNDIATVKKDVGKLDAGQEYPFDWTWANPTSLFIDPQAEVQFNKLITKAERDKMAKDHTTPTPDEKKLSVKSRVTNGEPAASATTGGSVGSYGPSAPNANNTVGSYSTPPSSTGAPPGFEPGGGNSQSPSGSMTPGGPPPGF